MITVTIREHRTQLHMTQEDLAIAVGVSRQTIISIEKGTYLPSLELAFKLSAALSVDMQKLFVYSA